MSLLLAVSVAAVAKRSQPSPEPSVAPLELLGGRTLIYERSFSSEREVKTKKGFWGKMLDIVAGAPDYHDMARPYSVVTDSHGRIIVTDPGLAGVHVFDFPGQKYKFLSRDDERDPLQSPQCVAVDSADNIYVTDSDSGKICVFDAKG